MYPFALYHCSKVIPRQKAKFESVSEVDKSTQDLQGTRYKPCRLLQGSHHCASLPCLNQLNSWGTSHLKREHGLVTERIEVDNGNKIISKALDKWA